MHKVSCSSFNKKSEKKIPKNIHLKNDVIFGFYAVKVDHDEKYPNTLYQTRNILFLIAPRTSNIFLSEIIMMNALLAMMMVMIMMITTTSMTISHGSWNNNKTTATVG